MTPRQQQLIEEYKELSEKMNKLNDHIISVAAGAERFNPAEQSRLAWQFYYMGEYAKVLKERIEASA